MKTLIHSEEREGFTIKCYALPEDIDPRDSFDPELEAEFDTFGKIERGELTWFCACVTASKAGVELASDYLGCCCYETFADFIQPDSYYTDMRKQVITDAKTKIAEMLILLTLHSKTNM